MTVETITRALGGHRAGATWMARCPVHEDRSPRFSISAGKDGTVLVRCHSWREQRDATTAFRSRGVCNSGHVSAQVTGKRHVSAHRDGAEAWRPARLIEP